MLYESTLQSRYFYNVISGKFGFTHCPLIAAEKMAVDARSQLDAAATNEREAVKSNILAHAEQLFRSTTWLETFRSFLWESNAEQWWADIVRVRGGHSGGVSS